MSGSSWRATAAALAALAPAACAHRVAAPAVESAAPVRLDGWAALVGGRNDEAAAAFAARLARFPADLPAAFGGAAIAFEHGDPRALGHYVAILRAAAASGAGAWAALFAPVAAARVGTLLEEQGDGAAADWLETLPRAALPWQARLEVARVGDAVARRAGDAGLLARLAAASGCVTSFVHAGVAGTLPHVDLDAAPAARAAGGLPLGGPGCRVTVPSREGRPGAQIVRARVEAAAQGRYVLALEFPGEARVVVDGKTVHRHGDENAFGPRRSAAVLDLAAGAHDLELRLATLGGDAEVVLLFAPAPPERAPPATGGAVEAEALAAFCAARTAVSTGDAEAALAAGAKLARTRFAAGLSLAALVAAADPTRPSSLGRDAARAAYRRSVEVDPAMARTWERMADLELADSRPREALEDAQRAATLAPAWWRPALTLYDAYRQRGLERDADRALDRALAAGGHSCPVLQAGLQRAVARHRVEEEQALADRLLRCDAQADAPKERLRARGEATAAEAAVRTALALDPRRGTLREDAASLRMAQGDAAGAVRTMRGVVDDVPHDGEARLRLGDALVAAGDAPGAARALAEALRRRPELSEVRRAAALLGIADPMDAFRVDGAAIIRAFEQTGRVYDASAVLVLDRTVERVFDDGARMILTHDIVRVQSKDGIERWGEVNVPAGAEVLTLRTRKPDGSTREPEDIAGKDTVSAPDLDVGDYVEWETLEVHEPADAFAPGFLGERFFFRSFDAPLDRSEYLLVTPRAMTVDVDARAGAPAAQRRDGTEGTVVRTFVAHAAAQVFGERSSAPPIEWVPSVRGASGVDLRRWERYLAEQIYGAARTAPGLRDAASGLARAGGAVQRAVALARFVTARVEDTGDVTESAALTLARGQGSRLQLARALARELGLATTLVLARSRAVADAEAPAPPQELDDFAEPLLRFDLPGGALFADLRLRHAALGYLLPALDGAPLLEPSASPPPAATPLGRAHGRGDDGRVVRLGVRLAADGTADVEGEETERGWPALEWADVIDRVGADRAALRQEVEQRFLGVHFPGGALREVEVSLVDGGAGGARLRYSFTVPALAQPVGQGALKLVPTFFRAQPARRYAVEAARQTVEVVPADVTLDLETVVTLPPGARVASTGLGAPLVIDVPGGGRFVEERRAEPGRLILRRQSRLPFRRVTSAQYAGAAALLRRVDAAEQAEVRIDLAPGEGP